LEWVRLAGKGETRERRGPSAEEAAFLDLARTADLLSRPVVQLLKTEDLSPAQYNVLRILRGAAPAGLTCGEIGNRMISRDPDITRLLDRLEKRGLISRGREEKDRRIVLTRITSDGMEMLAGLDQPVRSLHSTLLGHLGEERLRDLAELLAVCRDAAE
jgi:DNA-binding MarR family transcriptional regulator